MLGGSGHPLPPGGGQQSEARPASCLLYSDFRQVSVCVSVPPIHWQRNLNLRLWLAALLLRVSEAFGRYISLHFGQVSMWAECLTTLGRTNFRCQGQSSG